MQLPIDAANAPFKPKYIRDETEMLSDWFEFGKGDIQGGNNGNMEIFTGLSPEQVQRILAARKRFCDEIEETLNAPRGS